MQMPSDELDLDIHLRSHSMADLEDFNPGSPRFVNIRNSDLPLVYRFYLDNLVQCARG